MSRKAVVEKTMLLLLLLIAAADCGSTQVADTFQGLRIEAKKEAGDMVTVPRDPNRGNSEIYTSMQADGVATCFPFSLCINVVSG
jgi:hypothetical protein